MIAALVDVTSALAFLSALTVLLVSRSGRTALRVLLDLLIAASVLRLALAQSWTALAVAAAVVTLRQVLWAAVAAGNPGPDRTSPAPCGGDDHRLAWATRGEPGENRRRPP